MSDPIVEVEVPIKIPFHDVDAMAIAWHGHYVKYFEIARCELLDKFDYNYLQMKESNYSWPIVHLEIKYVKPALFGATVLVQAALIEYENRLKVRYLIRDEESGVRLTSGHTIQVAVCMKSSEMCLVSPPVVYEKLAAIGAFRDEDRKV